MDIKYENVTTTQDYILTANGIYNDLGEKVYDLTDKVYDTEILDYERNIVLISVLAEDGVEKIELFNNGKVTSVGKMDATGERENATGEWLYDFDTTSFGYYTVNVTKTSTKTNYTYKYYSVDGTLLATTDYRLSYVASYDGVYLYTGNMKTAAGITTPVYYKFS